MTYTVFHIGTYITLAAAILAAQNLGVGSLMHPVMRFSMAAFIIAGICGAVVASNLPESESWEQFALRPIGPWGLRIAGYHFWATIEHAVFWIGVLAPVTIAIFWPGALTGRRSVMEELVNGEVDIQRTELLINSVIAAVAVIALVISIGTVAWQLRHQYRLESKKVEHEYVRDLLAAIDKPLDVALANVVEVDYLRGTDRAAVQSAEALHRARPTLMAEMRDAYQRFANVASTIMTILPACRRRRGIASDTDDSYNRLNDSLVKLVNAHGEVASKYGNTAQLVHVTMADFESDVLITNTTELVSGVRRYACALLAELYVGRDRAG